LFAKYHLCGGRTLKNLALVRRPFSSVVVPLAQFVDQKLKMRGQTRRFRAQILLQPLAHGIADRSAGLAVDRFASVGSSAVHDPIPPGLGPFAVSSNQIAGAEIVPPRGRPSTVLLKICLKLKHFGAGSPAR
jgi:hypothetical protein